MNPPEPTLRLGWLQLPWYRHTLVEVPYRRTHVLLYLFCLASFASALGCSLIGVIGVALGAGDPILFGCAFAMFTLPAFQRIFAHGRVHWYFAEIEQESAQPDGMGRMGFNAGPEVREAERLLARIADPSLDPGERQGLRMALKALLNELAARTPPQVWQPLHARAPYLSVHAPR